jgi:hypothetical protein
MLRPGSCGDGPPGWGCQECGLEYLDVRADVRSARMRTFESSSPVSEAPPFASVG